jgi:hypothetical protein
MSVPKERIMDRKYVATGVLFLSTVLGGLGFVVYEGGPWVFDNAPRIARALEALGLIKTAEVDRPGPDVACKTWYLTTYYKAVKPEEQDEFVTWTACLKDDPNLSGNVKNHLGATGLAQGYKRGGTFTLAYASEAQDRYGFGYYALRPINPAPRIPSDPVAYAGFIVTHACDPGAKKGSTCHGPIKICPAIMSERPEPEPHLQARFFQKACTKPDVTWPDDPEETASAP